MMRVLPFALVGCSALLLICGFEVEALPEYRKRLPNGFNVVVNGVPVNAVGHFNPSGGGERNPFGVDFVRLGEKEWNTALCLADSDGDGFNNGFELGDPGCSYSVEELSNSTREDHGTSWSPATSHPGDATSFPSVSSFASAPFNVSGVVLLTWDYLQRHLKQSNSKAAEGLPLMYLTEEAVKAGTVAVTAQLQGEREKRSLSSLQPDNREGTIFSILFPAREGDDCEDGITTSPTHPCVFTFGYNFTANASKKLERLWSVLPPDMSSVYLDIVGCRGTLEEHATDTERVSVSLDIDTLAQVAIVDAPERRKRHVAATLTYKGAALISIDDDDGAIPDGKFGQAVGASWSLGRRVVARKRIYRRSITSGAGVHNKMTDFLTSSFGSTKAGSIHTDLLTDLPPEEEDDGGSLPSNHTSSLRAKIVKKLDALTITIDKKSGADSRRGAGLLNTLRMLQRSATLRGALRWVTEEKSLELGDTSSSGYYLLTLQSVEGAVLETVGTEKIHFACLPHDDDTASRKVEEANADRCRSSSSSSSLSTSGSWAGDMESSNSTDLSFWTEMNTMDLLSSSCFSRSDTTMPSAQSPSFTVREPSTTSSKANRVYLFQEYNKEGNGGDDMTSPSSSSSCVRVKGALTPTSVVWVLMPFLHHTLSWMRADMLYTFISGLSLVGTDEQDDVQGESSSFPPHSLNIYDVMPVSRDGGPISEDDVHQFPSIVQELWIRELNNTTSTAVAAAMQGLFGLGSSTLFNPTSVLGRISLEIGNGVTTMLDLSQWKVPGSQAPICSTEVRQTSTPKANFTIVEKVLRCRFSLLSRYKLQLASKFDPAFLLGASSTMTNISTGFRTTTKLVEIEAVNQGLHGSHLGIGDFISTSPSNAFDSLDVINLASNDFTGNLFQQRSTSSSPSSSPYPAGTAPVLPQGRKQRRVTGVLALSGHRRHVILNLSNNYFVGPAYLSQSEIFARMCPDQDSSSGAENCGTAAEKISITLDISGNQLFTTSEEEALSPSSAEEEIGSIDISNSYLNSRLVLDVDESGGVERRHNSFEVIKYECGSMHGEVEFAVYSRTPLFPEQKSAAEKLQGPLSTKTSRHEVLSAGHTIPSYCAGCIPGKHYNLADGSCSMINAATGNRIALTDPPLLDDDHGLSTVHIDDSDGTYCDHACGVTLGLLSLFLFLVVVWFVLMRKCIHARKRERSEVERVPIIPIVTTNAAHGAPVQASVYPPENIEEGDAVGTSHDVVLIEGDEKGTEMTTVSESTASREPISSSSSVAIPVRSSSPINTSHLNA